MPKYFEIQYQDINGNCHPYRSNLLAHEIQGILSEISANLYAHVTTVYSKGTTNAEMIVVPQVKRKWQLSADYNPILNGKAY